MSEIPRWISSKKVEIVRTLLSEDPAMLLRETMGISADGSEKAYRDDDVTAFEQRQADRMVWIDRDHRLNVMHFFVAVDPSGVGASAFSICSALTMPNGAIQVRAHASTQTPITPRSRPRGRRRRKTTAARTAGGCKTALRATA